MSSKTTSLSLADAAEAVGDLLGQGAKLGMGLLGSVTLPLPRKSCGCSCDIPPPCWAPQPLGDVTTRVCPGNKAVVRINVTNCGARERAIDVEATNAAVAVDPASLKLGPMEQGLVVLSLEVPAGAAEGETQKGVVWVRGCKEYFFRWTLEVACKATSCCVDIDVEDCPDLVHHWYDHFYCQRPCLHRA